MKRRYILVACLAAALKAQAQDLPASGFGPQQPLTTAAIGAQDVYAADLDQDGDLDVLSSSFWDNKIAWYENEGTGSFADQQIITTEAYGATSVYAADLDGDGDMNVLSASWSDNKIAWYENLNESANIKVDSITTARVGETIEIAISTSELQAEDNIISYQFTLDYDATKLEFVEALLSETIAEGGNLQVNSSTSGQLRFGYITSTPLSGSGPIVKLRFKVTDHGNSALTLSDFLYNAQEITRLIAGAVLEAIYGDVDADQQVLAYDASLVLQFSVGLDPLPTIDPLPWESWRITSADVDGEEGITAHDAALILQKAIGLLEQFPVENTAHARMQPEQATVELRVEEQEVVFYAKGEVVGFNLAADNTAQLFGTPVVLTSGLLQAFNSSPAAYAIGVASAHPLASNTAFLKIPFSGRGAVTFYMQVNRKPAIVTVDLATGLVERAAIEMYPNPVTEKLILTGITGSITAEIYSLSGELMLSSRLGSSSPEIAVAHLSKGVYILKLHSSEGMTVRRFIKQ